MLSNFGGAKMKKSYYVIEAKTPRKEINMNIDRNMRRTTRQEYNDFVNLLGMNSQKQAKIDTGSTNMPVEGHTSKSLAMVYAEEQLWRNIFDPEIALANGTIFNELHKPFMPIACSGRSNNFGEGCL
jgi:hypothetical protein